ncbi:MAG: hypothetical protein Q9170_008376, partial [Blastenia crenularia]
MLDLLIHLIFVFSFLPTSIIAAPSPISDHSLTHTPRTRRFQNDPFPNSSRNPHLLPRSTVSELLSSDPSISPSDLLLIQLSPNPTKYRLFFTSYTPFLPANDLWLTGANNASTALSSFYAAIASRSSSFGGQNMATKPAMAFGAGRVWIDFYGQGGKELVWKDL